MVTAIGLLGLALVAESQFASGSLDCEGRILLLSPLFCR